MKRILFVFGTRPEAIKLAPMILNFSKFPEEFKVITCSTGQHKEMLQQVLDFFSIVPDYDLKLMEPNQTLSGLTAKVLTGVSGVIEQCNPDMVVVQGDTTTVLAGAMAAFYAKVKVVHVEAGLRTGVKFSPFPEEMNRALTGRMADYHFTPTKASAENLRNEGITKNVWNVGNTVIDALHMGLDIIEKSGSEKMFAKFSMLDFNKKIILVTSHRRENFGEPFEKICMALKYIAEKYADQVEIVYPLHLNPNVQVTANKILSDVPNIKLLTPLDYQYLIWLMNKSYIVVTDSGGIQEEAPSLGKPVVVTRTVTERQEGVDAGTTVLAGTDKERISSILEELLTNNELYYKMSVAKNPFGDGTSSIQIKNILSRG